MLFSGVVCYEVAKQKVADPAYQDWTCYTQPTTDIAGMMGLPCGIVNGGQCGGGLLCLGGDGHGGGQLGGEVLGCRQWDSAM